MSFFDFITNPIDSLLTNILGKDIGGFLGSGGLGKAIEEWSNPITQLSDRNPILNLARGTGSWKGADESPKWYETSLNDINKAAALAYGGAAAGGLTSGLGTAGETSAGAVSGMEMGGNPLISSFIPETSSGAVSGMEAGLTPSTSSIITETPTYSPLTAQSPTPATGIAQGKAGIFGGMGNMTNTVLPLMAAGSLLDYGGSTQNIAQQESNKQDYINATTWTPERTNTYLSNLTNLVGGVYGEDEEKKKKSLANMMASSGRGGGAFNEATERLGRERKEAVAKALTQGLMTTSTPPSNLSPSLFNIPSASGTALTNLGGTAGKMANTYLMMQMLNGMR